nr:MAG TPA: hypothetical protein [Caudoviricetes sp.]
MCGNIFLRHLHCTGLNSSCQQVPQDFNHVF